MNKLLLLAGLLVLAVVQLGTSQNAVRLVKLKTLNLRRDRMTYGQNPIPQMQCFEEANDYRHFCRYQPNAATCKNSGNSRGNVIWRCTASMNKTLAFGRLDVSCLPFPGMPGYVIQNSCGLKYTLVSGFAANHLSKILFALCLIATIAFKRSL